MKLVQFTDNFGRENWINGDQVCSIVTYDKNTTEVHFGGELKLFLKEPVAAVAHKLFSGARS